MVAIGLPLESLGVEDDPGLAGAGFAFLREGYAWAVMAALFGYARRHIRKGSPLLTLATDAVFACYVVHQTAIVLAGHLLKPYRLSFPVEALTILAITVAACVGAYALARALPILRLPLGLKPLPDRTDRKMLAPGKQPS